MKASSKLALVTVLVRALSHCFHEALWAKSAFMCCMETYRVLDFSKGYHLLHLDKLVVKLMKNNGHPYW